MTVKKQGENQGKLPPMKGFSWGVLIGAFIGNFMVQIWGAKKVGMRFTMAFDFRHGSIALCSSDTSFNDQLVQIGMKRLLDF